MTTAGNVARAAASSFKDVFAAGARSITATLQGSDITLSNIAEQEEAVHSFFGVNMRTLETMNTELMGRGKQTGKDSLEAQIPDLLAGGHWVDYKQKQIPTLNTDLAFPKVSQEDTSDWLFKVLLGNLINSIWKKQGVWITALKMTQEECESNWPGNGDHRLKLCQNGKGYFLQRIFNKHNLVGDDDWTAVLPQFWGQMEEKYQITPMDAMKSSVAAFDAGGFEFRAESIIDGIFEKGGKIEIADFPGIFTLPICDFETTTWVIDKSLGAAMEWIEKPGFSCLNDVGTGA